MIVDKNKKDNVIEGVSKNMKGSPKPGKENGITDWSIDVVSSFSV